VAREPWEDAHIDRFRNALVMLRIPDPDLLIAERLSGQSPFTATDHFADLASLPGEELHAPAAQEPPASAAIDIPIEEPEPVRPPAAAQKPGPVEIDLTTMLGDLEGTTPMPTPPDPQNLDQVFQDFREEVSRQTGNEEAEQHMKLAITFLEMDMADEAIGSLTTAARSPRHRFEASAMLARLYRDQQDLTHAIEWFERAAEAPAPSAEDARALLYDLGAALETIGESARALAVFMELQADAGEYRDVSDRVEHLARVQAGG